VVDAVVLLGWMKQEVAVAFLRERCAFADPLSSEDAAGLWARHRRLAEQLPERSSFEAESVRLSPQEEVVVAAFLEEQARSGGPVASVVKVDPARLRIRQLGVTLDRCHHFGRACRTRQQWIEQWLNPAPTSMEGKVRATTNAIDVELPHPEFILGFDSALGFQVVEAPRYVTVAQSGGSTTLMAGHHRAYAYLTSDCFEPERAILAAVLSDRSRDVARSSAVMEGAEEVCTRCPPTMADFLDERHAFHVKMRPRRFELQVRARMAVVPA
jgi:hypothetical protein